MPAHRTLARLSTARTRKTATAALATAGAAALAFTVAPVSADAGQPVAGQPAAGPATASTAPAAAPWDLRAEDVPDQRQPAGPDGGDGSLVTGLDQEPLETAPSDDTDGGSGDGVVADGPEARTEPPAAGPPRQQREAAPEDPGTQRPRERAQAPAERAVTPSTTRAAERSQPAAQQEATTVAYSNTLDGWIRQSLDIMAAQGIPGTYDGLYRNIMRESSGDPNAINLWDVNALNGTPSIGLLQVIQPTFDAYHVPGTAYDLYDPVANICAAANYAADRYGSIDNVYGPY